MSDLFICSLKHAPGLRKEFLLLGLNFQKHGARVQYCLARPYCTDFPNIEGAIHPVVSGKGGWFFLLEALLLPLIVWRFLHLAWSAGRRPVFLFYNTHPIQPFLQRLLMLFTRARIVTVLHEPNKTMDDLKKYGVKGFMYFGFAMLIQTLSVRFSNYIVTMSPYGAELFAQKYPRRTDSLIAANLLLPKLDDSAEPVEREYFAFVGTVNRGKNIDDIVATVNAILAGKVPAQKFLIITASDISTYMQQLSSGWEKYLKIVNKPDIPDADISKAIRQAKAVLILHKTASQSGVLPLSYSLSTPVIVRDLKAFTQYVDGSGIVLDQEFTPAALSAACTELARNQAAYCEGADQQFSRWFSQEKFKTIYQPLLNDLTENG